MSKQEHHSLMQAVAKRILPTSWFKKLELDSGDWFYECEGCGKERSVWDAGGIRFAGAPARKLVACTACKRVGFANVSRKHREDVKPSGESRGTANRCT